MSEPRWLPTEAEIKIHMARQREERARMSQRVCDGPQTILMPKGGTQAQRSAYAAPVLGLQSPEKPRRDWLAIAAWITIAAVWSAFSVFGYLVLSGGGK
jgi:predicted Abi (CAAX) family protease